MENDDACKWVSYDDGIESFNFSKKDGYYPAVAVIGDRFYHGNKFLPFEEIKKTFTGMDGSWHDMNHWGTNYFQILGSNIEWIVGHNDGTYIDEDLKQMVTAVFIENSAAKSDVFNGFMNICRNANRVPNVSVSFWADKTIKQVKDLTEEVDIPDGMHDDDEIFYLHTLEWKALSTVLEGACNDGDGCGIGIFKNQVKTTNVDNNSISIQIEHNDELNSLIKEILKEKIKKEKIKGGK